MSIEKVNPVVVDSIEFYVSNDGTKSGMSISGLAAFITVDRKSLVNLVDKVFDPQPGDTEVPELLEPFIGGSFDLGIVGSNGAKILSSRMCEAIIFYYAFKSNKVSATVKENALTAYRNFANIGLHEFFCRSGGKVETNDASGLLAEFQQVLGQLKELNQFATQYKTIREKTSIFLPGANDLLDHLADESSLLEPCEDGKVSLEGWLHQKGITLSATKFRSMAHLVGSNYKAWTKKDPEKRNFKSPDKNIPTKYNVYVYEPSAYPILQVCLNKILSDLN